MCESTTTTTTVNRHRVSPELIRSRTCVKMDNVHYAESPAYVQISDLNSNDSTRWSWIKNATTIIEKPNKNFDRDCVDYFFLAGSVILNYIHTSISRFSQRMKMSRLTRDGTAEPVSRDQILRRERGQGNEFSLFS